LGRRGLFHATGGTSIANEINARLWVLNLSDGEHSLLDIAERAHLPFSAVREAADLLRENGLLEPMEETNRRDPSR
jgi:aminopeptidase-like protein